jgi:hypothetical protein
MAHCRALVTTMPSCLYATFKADVESALRSFFGTRSVTRGNKAFGIHENSYRTDADVVACFEYKRYQANGLCPVGTAFKSDAGTRIINWPEQNYANGVSKNDETGRRFKAVVRILKNLRNRMDAGNVRTAKSITSFPIECLVWNVPSPKFQKSNYAEGVRAALAYIFNNTLSDDLCNEWGEVNELKYLFRYGQPCSRAEAHAFISDAWDFIGFS